MEEVNGKLEENKINNSIESATNFFDLSILLIICLQVQNDLSK